MTEETYCSAMHCAECEAEVDPGDVDQQGRHAQYDRDGTLEIHRGVQSCGAPIPRLDEGPCQYDYLSNREWDRCRMRRDHHIHHPDAEMQRQGNGHAYVGPLAPECAAGHPVAVPTEAERRG